MIASVIGRNKQKLRTARLTAYERRVQLQELRHPFGHSCREQAAASAVSSSGKSSVSAGNTMNSRFLCVIWKLCVRMTIASTQQAKSTQSRSVGDHLEHSRWRESSEEPTIDEFAAEAGHLYLVIARKSSSLFKWFS